jgi:hypothetical protein
MEKNTLILFVLRPAQDFVTNMGVTIADDEMQNLGLGSARTSF